MSRNTTKEWYHICVNGEEIVCTGGHPFYVLNAEEDRKIVRYQGVKSDKNGRWIEAKELKTSDKLLLSDGTCAIINSVAVETLENPETTYNFEVEDFHTYFVSESNVLVHNSCRNAWEKERKRYWKEQGTKYQNSIDENALSKSGTYNLSKNNINRMLRGRAPIGIDGKSVNLHHVRGLMVDPLDYIELTRTEHYSNFKTLHPWMYR